MIKSDYICPKTIWAHMVCAEAHAKLSHATKHKVGCIIVKYNTPIASGCNGTMPGDSNDCEAPGASLVHAEPNALKKLERLTETAIGALAVVTREPCANCVKELWMSGIEKVVFRDIRNSGHCGLIEAEKRGVKLWLLKDDLCVPVTVSNDNQLVTIKPGRFVEEKPFKVNPHPTSGDIHG